MTKWEYKVEEVCSLNFELNKTLNERGLEGWELVYSKVDETLSQNFVGFLIFKRPLPSNDEEENEIHK